MDVVTLGAAKSYALNLTKAKLTHGLRTVLLGDSYMASEYSVTGTANAVNGTVEYPARGFVNWANFWLGGRLSLVGNLGVSGEQTTQWAARYDAGVPALTPDIVIMGSAGINDRGNGRTAAQVLSTLQGMFDKNAALGALTVMLGPVPMGSATTGDKTFVHTMAALLRREAQSRRNFILIDAYPALSDMTDTDSWLGLPDAKYTADGTHLGLWGAMRVGKLLATALDKILPPYVTFPAGTASTYATTDKNLLANPGLVGTSGTVANGATGSVATSWTVSAQSGSSFAGTVAASKVAATDLTNMDWQQVAVSSANSDPQFFQHITTGLTVGKTVVGVMELDSSDWQPNGGSGALRLRLQCRMGGAGSSFAQGLSISGIDESLGFASDLQLGTGVVVTPPLVMGSGVDRLSLILLLRGQGTIRARRAAIMQID